MAIYHFSAKVIQRSAGRSAVAAAAYRAAERLHEVILDLDRQALQGAAARKEKASAGVEISGAVDGNGISESWSEGMLDPPMAALPSTVDDLDLFAFLSNSTPEGASVFVSNRLGSLACVFARLYR